MGKEIMKNINKEEILQLSKLVNYQNGQIVSKTLVQNSSVSLTLFAFDKDEEISTHASHGDAMVSLLDGKAQITIGEKKFNLSAGETIIMPAEVPHAVYASEKMKFILTVVF
jgi:quercetin dioxygenase-like cupin family protein